MFRSCSLKLGGKNPNILFADCITRSARDNGAFSFSNQGESALRFTQSG